MHYLKYFMYILGQFRRYMEYLVTNTIFPK